MSMAITSINPFDGSVVGVTEPITAEELELRLERARRAAGTWARTEERVAGARVRTVPLGVIAAITPRNVPLVTPLWKLCPALMAGNAVIWKPSELSTLVARATTRLFLEAGIPDSVLQLAAGNGAVGAALVADPRVDGVHFTGSDGTGRSIAKTTGARLGRAALELGGSSPAIVLDDAVDAAADAIVAAATAVNGQKCTATRRVVATPGAAPAVAAAIARRLAALRPGDPASAETTLGPLASVHSADPERARAVAARLESGIVAINRRTDDVALEAPFGGLKASGNGVPEGGQYAYRGVGALQSIYETP